MALLAGSVPCRADIAPKAAGTPIPDSDWVSYDPKESAGEDGLFMRDKSEFRQKLANEGTNLCRQLAHINGGFKLYGGDILEVGGRYSLDVIRKEDRSLVLYEEFAPQSRVNYNKTWEITDDIGASIQVGSDFTARSVVVRPLQTYNNCAALKKEFDPTYIKTVLPMTAARIMAMEPKELWKMEVAYNIHLQSTLSATYHDVTISLYAASNPTDNDGNVTLYRMSDDQLRFRIRLDSALVKADGLTVTASPLEPSDLFNGSSILRRILGSKITKYVQSQLAYFVNTRKGEKVLIEFILDPKNKEQMESLARVIRGELFSLEALVKSVKPANGLAESAEKTRDAIQAHAQLDTSKLGVSASYAAADDYVNKLHNLTAKIPFFFDNTVTWGKENQDRYVLLNKTGDEVNIMPGTFTRETKIGKILFMGALHVYNTSKNAIVFTAKDNKGTSPNPGVLYLQQQGFKRGVPSAAQDMVLQANKIMRYIGVKGNGTNPRTQLPISPDALQPGKVPSPKLNGEAPRAGTFKSGVVALAVFINSKGVQDFLGASHEDVIKAYINAQDAAVQAVMLPLLAKADTKIEKDGTISYKESSISGQLAKSGKDAPGAVEAIRSVARAATYLIKDLERVRNIEKPEARADALRRLIDGAGNSGLSYQDLFKVLVQLTDPMNVSAEYQIVIDKCKGEPNISLYGRLNEKAADDTALKAMQNAVKRERQTKISD